MSGPAIEVSGLSKRYVIEHESRHDNLRDTLHHIARKLWRRFRWGTGFAREEFWALRDVSFSVQPGEVVGIIGRNGAGKSTLLKILSRITEATTGRVTLRGRVASLLEVGTGFHPDLTGRENIFLNGAILGMSRAEIRRKFDEIVAFAEVEKFLDTPVKRYSSGMYVRLAFAVAAHLEPEILIVDEVLAVGDAAFQKKCLGKMRDVSTREQRAVLFVSHNMAAVQSLCQRAIWLSAGRIAQTGPVSSVVSQYVQSGVIATAERHWEAEAAPGDDRVRLRAARVHQGGSSVEVVDINQPSQIELTFETLRECRNLITGCNFYDATGTCLFAHCDWRPNVLPPGRYRKQIELPAQLFAEGKIVVLVQLVFHDPMVLSVILPDALAFEAIDSDSPQAVRGLYHGYWPGAVRIGLQWSDASPA
ncbi:polysaccharide ABC transporter ATP-binding protein [Opitutus terrae]|uniref:ABC transporter related n=1 Tax=Opitutus terrae (strain DSM 11246 / JCM 15787 / PB90-1) TaxID=452637 RepID=B1ZW37_OPITP|nr:polysaccharide ABC transporter ATP-binding protein [Opitutus terrae]ACB76051.1 ABC transporter related [Opitutus terrae PB90-1]